MNFIRLVCPHCKKTFNKIIPNILKKSDKIITAAHAKKYEQIATNQVRKSINCENEWMTKKSHELTQK